MLIQCQQGQSELQGLVQLAISLGTGQCLLQGQALRLCVLASALPQPLPPGVVRGSLVGQQSATWAGRQQLDTRGQFQVGVAVEQGHTQGLAKAQQLLTQGLARLGRIRPQHQCSSFAADTGFQRHQGHQRRGAAAQSQGATAGRDDTGTAIHMQLEQRRGLAHDGIISQRLADGDGWGVTPVSRDAAGSGGNRRIDWPSMKRTRGAHASAALQKRLPRLNSINNPSAAKLTVAMP